MTRVATWSLPWREADPLASLVPRRYRRASSPREDTLRLSQLVEIVSGTYVRGYVAPDSEDAVPYLRVDNVREFVPNLTETDLVYIRRSALQPTELERVSVRQGDVVTARTGTLGKAFVVGAGLEGAILSQHLTRLRPCADPGMDAALPLLLAAYLNSRAGKDAILARAAGSTRPELTHEALAALPVQLPEMPEGLCARAVRMPHLFDKMRGAAEEAVRVAAELGRAPSVSKLAQLSVEFLPWSAGVGAGSWLPRYWHRAALTAEAELSLRYECLELGALARVERGSGSHATEYAAEGIPYLRTSSLINFATDFFPDHYGSAETYAGHGTKCRPGDVLLSIEGKIGCVALVGLDERYLLKNHIEIIRPSFEPTVSPAFLFALLASPLGQLQLARRTVVQSTIPGLASGSRTLLVPVAARSGRDVPAYESIAKRIDRAMSRHLKCRAELRETLMEIKSLT